MNRRGTDRLPSPTRLQMFLCLAVTAVGIGCATRVPRTEPSPNIGHSYVDLQPGWRVRTVTPILKSGKYKPELKEMATPRGAAELSAGDDFVGYETSYYAVVPGEESGVTIAFVSAARTINGKTSRQSQPLVRLFDFSGSQYVRIVFLMRVSQADHNQAILAAATPDDLDRLTQRVEADPAINCTPHVQSYCTWVPEGMAVRPEKRDPAHRNGWVPAT